MQTFLLGGLAFRSVTASVDRSSMASLTDRNEWKALSAHLLEMKNGIKMAQMFESDPDRFAKYHLSFKGDGDEGVLLFDYSKNIINQRTMTLLLDLVRACGFEAARDAMFSGERINVTENRAVLHIALRNRCEPLAIIPLLASLVIA